MADVFTIDLTDTAYGHLQALRRFDRNRVLDAIKEQLALCPGEETRNRKILRSNPIADWELRVDPFRVFYEVDPTRKTVRVVAVGLKRHNRLTIGGEEIEI
jgi:mRNA-degrading endonuclease RelE of RelBE toxin-antitoxin system